MKTNRIIHNSTGFTLAEVLITLGILGIVSIITLPTLMQKYQEKIWNISANIFEKRLANALKIMNTNQALSGYQSSEDFISELSKHIKIIKTCNNTELNKCFSSEITTQTIDLDTNNVSNKSIIQIQNLKKLSQMNQTSQNDTNVVGLQFANGVNALIAYNPQNCYEDPYSSQFNGFHCISMLYDTTGYANPNELSKDVRSVNTHFSAGIKFGGKYYTMPFQPSPISKTECEKLLGSDNCPTNTDYWAGAIKTCGGIDKMLSVNDAIVMGKKLDKETANKIIPPITIGGNRSDIFLNEVAPPSDIYTTYKLNVKSVLFIFYNSAIDTGIQEYTVFRDYNHIYAICLY